MILIRSGAAAIIALGFALPAWAEGGPAEGLPFVGVWDCDYGQFTLTDLHYRPGTDDPLVIRSVVDQGGGTFEVHFDDDYWIGLTMNGEREMAWFSGASGDGFDCRLTDE